VAMPYVPHRRRMNSATEVWSCKSLPAASVSIMQRHPRFGSEDGQGAAFDRRPPPLSADTANHSLGAKRWGPLRFLAVKPHPTTSSLALFLHLLLQTRVGVRRCSTLATRA
jgi:hypothetical protein